MITEYGMKTICEFVGVGLKKCIMFDDCFGAKSSTEFIRNCNRECKQGFDFNVLIQAIILYGKTIDDYIIDIDENFTAIRIFSRKGREGKRIKISDYPTTEEALATAILWVLKEIG